MYVNHNEYSARSARTLILKLNSVPTLDSFCYKLWGTTFFSRLIRVILNLLIKKRIWFLLTITCIVYNELYHSLIHILNILRNELLFFIPLPLFSFLKTLI